MGGFVFRFGDGISLRCARRGPRMRPVLQPTAFLLVMLVAVGCMAAAQNSVQDVLPAESDSSVHGTVINAVTRAPVARALVYSPDNRYATLTDGEGHFEFALSKVSPEPQNGMLFSGPGPAPRPWTFGRLGIPFWFLARKPGFLDDPDANRQAEVSSGGGITISLMPEALIKGRVTFSAAEAAAGITVQLLTRQVQEGLPRWIPGMSVRANSNGEFRFAELLPGTYKIVTHEWMENDPLTAVPGSQLYGYAPVYFPGVADFAAASAIQLSAGQTFEADLSLTRQPYFPVKIPVENAEVRGMNVNVSVQGHRGPGYSLGYNPSTQRIEGLLPNGNYLVEAAAYGPTPATGTVSLAVAGGPAEGPTQTLIPGSSLRLEVKEEFSDTKWRGETFWNDGKRNFTFRHGPRSYLQVRAEATDDFEHPRNVMIRPPTGPEDESLVLENLAPGRYWLLLNSGRGYVASATMGGVDLLREPLVVGAGTSAPIEIVMRDDSAQLEGTVAGISAQPNMTAGSANLGFQPSQVWVYCVPLPDSPGHFQQIGVSYDGNFSYPMVPGTYRLLAFRNQQPNLPYRDAEAMRAYETKGQVIHLAAGEKANVQVQPIPGSQ